MHISCHLPKVSSAFQNSASSMNSLPALQDTQLLTIPTNSSFPKPTKPAVICSSYRDGNFPQPVFPSVSSCPSIYPHGNTLEITDNTDTTQYYSSFLEINELTYNPFSILKSSNKKTVFKFPILEGSKVDNSGLYSTSNDGVVDSTGSVLPEHDIPGDTCHSEPFVTYVLESDEVTPNAADENKMTNAQCCSEGVQCILDDNHNEVKLNESCV